MDAPGFLALAFGDEAKLGVREGREGYLELAQQPRAQPALDLVNRRLTTTLRVGR
jgi:hypothetical protein